MESPPPLKKEKDHEQYRRLSMSSSVNLHQVSLDPHEPADYGAGTYEGGERYSDGD